jgi:hypothetical protein
MFVALLNFVLSTLPASVRLPDENYCLNKMGSVFLPAAEGQCFRLDG